MHSSRRTWNVPLLMVKWQSEKLHIENDKISISVSWVACGTFLTVVYLPVTSQLFALMIASVASDANYFIAQLDELSAFLWTQLDKRFRARALLRGLLATSAAGFMNFLFAKNKTYCRKKTYIMLYVVEKVLWWVRFPSWYTELLTGIYGVVMYWFGILEQINVVLAWAWFEGDRWETRVICNEV